MAKKFLTSIDLNGNQLIKPVLENVATNPTNDSIKGRIAFNTGLNKIIVHDGINWRELQYEIPANTYLDKDSHKNLIAIEALAGTSGFLKKTAANTWSLDTSTYLLSTENAVSATTLKNPRAFSIKGGATAEAINFNGSDDVVLDVTAIDPSKITQSTDYNLVTDAEKTTWDEKETPEGAQTKATTALTQAKNYVDGKVLTNVPEGALFSDTITTINDKTGVITKEDITALGIPGDISGKVDKVDGYGLSENDFTTDLKDKLDAIPADATNLELGDTETTAYRGDHGKAAYTHISDAVKHITAAERTAWNAKETPDDAQAKAAQALGEANTYTDEKIGTVNASLAEKSDKTHNHNLKDLTEKSYNSLDNKPSLGTVASLNTGTSSGNVPILGSDGKLNDIVIPKIAISETSVIESEVEMLALTAEIGDIAIRNDVKKSFILKGDNPKELSNWQELITPMSPVQSVNGKTGTVVLSKEDVGLSNVDNTSDDDKPVSTAQSAALDLKADITYVDDKVKTDVPADAKFTDTVYKHPETHSADMITETTDRRFVTDAQISAWTSSEGSIPDGTTTQYFRGDKKWATLNTDAVTEGTNKYYTDERVKTYGDTLYLGKTATASQATKLASSKDFSIAGNTGLTATAVSFNGEENVALSLAGNLKVANGGTGLTDAKDGFTRKVVGTLTTSATSYEITHGLGRDVVVQVIEVASNAVVECDIIMTSTTKVTIQFNKAPDANAYRYIIIG